MIGDSSSSPIIIVCSFCERCEEAARIEGVMQHDDDADADETIKTHTILSKEHSTIETTLPWCISMCVGCVVQRQQ
jgi:hypothetical protein